MSYSVFRTMTVAGAVAEATLSAQARDREQRKNRTESKRPVLGVIRDWLSDARHAAARRELGC